MVKVVTAAVAWRRGLIGDEALISAVDAYLNRAPIPRRRVASSTSAARRALKRAEDVIATVRGGSDRLLTAEEATEALGLRSSRTLLRWARAGRVESITSPSGKIMFWQSYIAEWIRDGDPPTRGSRYAAANGSAGVSDRVGADGDMAGGRATD